MFNLKFAFVFSFLIVCVLSRTTTINQNSIQDDNLTIQRSDDTYSYMGDLRYVYKVYQQCVAQDLFPCLKLKLISALDKAARSYNLELVDGVTFVKDNKVQDEANESVKSEAEIAANLPRSYAEKDDVLTNLIFKKISSFLDSHSLQIKLPSSLENSRSFNGDEQDEARGKKKKGNALLLFPLILGGTLVPLALGALALLAGKALIVSKLALVLASIIGLKKLLSGSSGHQESGHVEVVSGGGHHGSGWGRSYDKEEAAKLAYQAYEPKKSR